MEKGRWRHTTEKPMAKEQCLPSAASRPEPLGMTIQTLKPRAVHAGKAGIEIGKPFQARPEMSCAMDAKIGKQVVRRQRPQGADARYQDGHRTDKGIEAAQ